MMDEGGVVRGAEIVIRFFYFLIGVLHVFFVSVRFMEESLSIRLGWLPVVPFFWDSIWRRSFGPRAKSQLLSPLSTTTNPPTNNLYFPAPLFSQIR